MDRERKLTPRGRDRRRSIIAAATRRFAEQGYHPTSVQDICSELGVGKGVFYWYFESKDDLLREILRQALFDLRSAQQHAIDAGGDPLGRLEAGIRASMRWYAANGDLVRLTLFCWSEEQFADALLRGRRVSLADTARHVREAIETGVVEPADPELVAAGIVGVIDELGRSLAFGDRELDEELEQFAVDMCLFGATGKR